MGSQKKQKNNVENKNVNKNNQTKIKDHFFIQKVWFSMTKFEYYPEMAAHGVPRAFVYLTQLIAIFSVILTIIVFAYVNKSINTENQTEELSLVQRFEKTLDIKINEEQANELKLAFSQYDSKTLEVMFVVASAISIFISYFIVTLIDILILSLFGMMTCFFTKIKIKYRAVFNMSVYAITISVILRLIYEGLLLLGDFKIKYFNVMYTSISYICLAAAIFMIRSDLIKQQIELMKVIEEKKRKAFEEEQKEDKRKEEEKDEKDEDDENTKSKNKEPKDKEEEVGRGEEQGSNA